MVGLALDIFDWTCVGLIPILGDVADVAALLYWVRFAGIVGLAETLELIPLPIFDILPINTLLGLYADSRTTVSDPTGSPNDVTAELPDAGN
jgi:hypothetical protein